MKTALLLALALAVPGDDATKKDLDKLVGEWTVATAEKGGKKLSEDDRKKVSEWMLTKVVIKEDSIVPWISHNGAAAEEGKSMPFTLDLSKTPRQLNLVHGDNSTMTALYKFDGDTLKVCVPETLKGEAPASFDTAKEASAYVFVFKRVKK